MKVIDHSPRFWFLLREDDNYFLDVSCSSSFVGYDFTIQLNDKEKENYSNGGSAYIAQLAKDIQYSSPGSIDSKSEFRDRRVDQENKEKVRDAIMRWK